jgi:hypothetical protein
MRFDPKKREDFLLAKGTYDAVVERAEEKVSKTGNDMIAISLRVYNGAQSVFINDWLLAGSQKLLDFCEVSGLADAYMRGEACLDRNVTVKVGIDPAKDGYDAKNKIAGYVMKKEKATAAASQEAPAQSAKGLGVSDSQRKAAANAPADDEIPF